MVRSTKGAAALFWMAAVAFPPPARADIKIIGSFQYWDAFVATIADGSRLCGIGQVWANGVVLTLKKYENIPELRMEIFKPSWNIPRQSRIFLKVKFGLFSPWDIATTGSDNVISIALEHDNAKQFVHEFTSSDDMTVLFIGGNEPPLLGYLKGSSNAIDAMAKCVDSIAHPGDPNPFGEPATQPFTTQPFSAQSAPPTMPPRQSPAGSAPGYIPSGPIANHRL